MPKKRVVLLGSTGSIGQSTLKVVEDLRDRVELVGIAAGRNAGMWTVGIAQTGNGLGLSEEELSTLDASLELVGGHIAGLGSTLPRCNPLRVMSDE